MKKAVLLVLVLVFILSLCGCSGLTQSEGKSLSVQINGISLKGVYTGAQEGLKPHGDGTFTVSEGGITASYTGTWKDGLPSREGSFVYNDGLKQINYTGGWQEGKFTDAGTLESNCVNVTVGNLGSFTGSYCGEVKNGVPHGEGQFISGPSSETVCSYSGTWKDGSPFELGQLEIETMDVVYLDREYRGSYSGEAMNGIPWGMGDFISTEGEGSLSYSGIWNNGSIVGPGDLEVDTYILDYLYGLTFTGSYSGQIADGLPEGEGTFEGVTYTGEPVCYTGEWAYGLWNGYGSLTYPASRQMEPIGQFVDCEFTPTVADFFTTIGTLPGMEYRVSQKAWDFMFDHYLVFWDHEVKEEPVEFETNFQYSAFAADPSQYGGKLFTMPQLRVVAILADTMFDIDYSRLILEDGMMNRYYVHMFGHWDNIASGSFVNLTALPLDCFTYVDDSGMEIRTMACAGVCID